MSSLTPPVPLVNQCSIVQDSTLYVYTPTAFLSLPLQQNATWSRLPNGVSVAGAACVKGQDNGIGSGVALWVVGGSPLDDSNLDYSGLQKYSFLGQQWQTVTPQVKVTQNRRNHAAAFLNSSSSILIYAGSQDDPNTPSIETFTVDTTFPYNVLSFSSANSPVMAPLLMAWNDTSAVTVGGNDQSRDVYLFNPDTKSGWSDYDTMLPDPLKGSDSVQATLVQGSDGSKVLEVYDMSVSPNEVSSIVLQNSELQPAQPGQTVGRGSPGKTKRDLSLDNWPPYNNSEAPTQTRQGYSLAASPAELAVMLGGNDQQPIALFNQQQNAWIDPNKFFGVKENNVQSVLGPTHTPSTTTAPPASSSTTGSHRASNHHRTSIILGAVLGSILGLIVLLIIILAIFTCSQRRKRKAKSAQLEDEKRRLSFADRGAPYMMDTVSTLPRGKPRDITHSSMAVLTGNISPNHQRGETRGSDSSTTRLVPKKGNAGQFAEGMEMSPIRESVHQSSTGNRTLPLASDSSKSNSSAFATPAKRTSGWSRYFSGSNSAFPAAAGSVRSPRKSGPSERYSGDTSSNYASSSNHDCSSHGPTEIPPLRLGQQFQGGRISRMVTGSPPASNHSSVASRRDTTTNRSLHSSRDSRPRTFSSARSSDPPSTIDETLFTQPRRDEQTHWSPVTRSDWTGPKLRDGAPSSVYSHTPQNSESLPKGLNPIIEDTHPMPQTEQQPTAGGARVSDPDTWPRPPSTAAVKMARRPPPLSETKHAAVPYKVANDDDNYVIDDAPATPTAITAIPVPASTAMQYTVKKSPKAPAGSDNLSWVRIS